MGKPQLNMRIYPNFHAYSRVPVNTNTNTFVTVWHNYDHVPACALLVPDYTSKLSGTVT